MPALRELRLRVPLSQRELAARAGVAERTVIHAENGQRAPRFRTMRQIAEALGVDWREVDEFRRAVEIHEGKAAA